MKKELLTYKDPKSPVSEIFRTLRTNIQFMNTNRKLKTLLVTSTFPEEGKSWITANLAVTFAQAGKKVILIDADMRKGRQYTIFGALPKPGLSNYLSNMDANNNETNDINISNYIQETDVENLHILTAGNVPPNPSELLVSRKMRNLLQQLKEMCDLIIIDGTPCDLVTDAIILSRIVDSTLIVTAQKQTKKDNLSRIVKNIQNVGGKIAGVVVNKVDMSTKKYNQAYYYGSISGSGMNSNNSKKESKKVEEFFSGFLKSKEDKIDLPEVEEDIEEQDFEETQYEEEKTNFDEPEYEEPDFKEPEYDEPENEKQEYEEEKYEEPKYEETKNEGLKYEEPKYEAPKHEELKYEDVTYDKEDTQKIPSPGVFGIEENIPEDFNFKTNYYDELHDYNNYKEIEAKIEPEGKISEVRIDKNMDEKTKEILRQVNEYIEAEKRRQGEKY